MKPQERLKEIYKSFNSSNIDDLSNCKASINAIILYLDELHEQGKI